MKIEIYLERFRRLYAKRNVYNLTYIKKLFKHLIYRTFVLLLLILKFPYVIIVSIGNEISKCVATLLHSFYYEKVRLCLWNLYYF